MVVFRLSRWAKKYTDLDTLLIVPSIGPLNFTGHEIFTLAFAFAFA